MKKSLKKREGEKPRRLTLSRETLNLLDAPQLLQQVGGGSWTDITTSGPQEISTQTTC